MTAEEEEAIATGIKYPRSMLLLELDDGIGITAEERAQQLDAGPCVLAVEMERLEGLRMGSTMLGCKVCQRCVHAWLCPLELATLYSTW